MQTSIAPDLLATPLGQDADRILRKCVHCGFCNATCPTYQITGDELDGPRGRIYQIKDMLEGVAPGEQTLLHLDRCLTCRNCETTCPSGVPYAELLDIGRHLAEQQVARPLPQKLQRALLRRFFLSPLFSLALKAGRLLRPALPEAWRRMIPQQHSIGATQDVDTRQPWQQTVLLVGGCVQNSLQPAIDLAARSVFKQLDLHTVVATDTRCCGALSHHLSAERAAIAQIKHNIDHWLQQMQQHDCQHLTMTASGCGVMIRDYARLLQHDAAYADKARRISEAYRDPIELVRQQLNKGKKLNPGNRANGKRIAFHPPCTLQHGQKITGQVEALLQQAGYELLPFNESHLCCGSAGTYSITQKSLSMQLRQRKLNHIEKHQPELIVTANIGCQTHLQSGTDTPVLHWLEVLAPQSLRASPDA